MDQFSALKAFCRVVEAGGFSAAAAQLNISHTVMSRQVQHLESLLGAQLLNRTTRKLALTEVGTAYYERARRILDDLQEADLAVTQHHAAPRGVLRVNAPMAFGTLDMASWLPRFMARYPDLKVDLVCNDRFVDLIEEGFDVAVRLAREMPDSTLMAKRLATTRTLLVAAPAYLERHGVPRTPDDLVHHNCLTYSLVPKPNEWMFEMPGGGYKAVAVRGTLQANTGIALRDAALAGVGIATTASFIVHGDLARGDLTAVLPGYPLQAREVYAVYPHNRHLSPKVRAFIDFAAEMYRTPAWA
ncbi:MAG TPA: LysR family transcriptional regulator [Noviherbaspirillum sp.]|uniref:LysR family transcriptional regulator n=1 Tax=Noviherbaspirillum sp. TaxID=1926288 RepID=UPI002B4818AC|nr:LysR family transcriptional regulator [Noviherbaspirillum sp.]HJV87329.1 LysR family transcriptional regulator [Noviherbaspirillum sp.]